MPFKSDESFLRYLTMGAAGTATVGADLDRRHHRVIELERHSASNKIWNTKIKRLRVPDLVCLRCGVRVEARGKSKLEIKVSDSRTLPGRRWDAGLRDDDLFAFTKISWDGLKAVAGPWVEYFRVGDLRAATDRSREGQRKAAAEGAELDRTWPASTLGYDAAVIEVSPTHIIVARNGVRQPRIPLRPGFLPYVAPGDAVPATGRLIAGVVPKPLSIDCPGDRQDWFRLAASSDAGMRYAAVKALGVQRDLAPVVALLSRVWENLDEDYRIRLEALGALARRCGGSWVAILGAEALRAPSPDMSMEAVFILSEVGRPEAANELVGILLRRDLPDELRAAAAWGIGIGGGRRPELLLDYLDDPNDFVAIHTIVAMGSDLPDELLERLAGLLQRTDRLAAAALRVLVEHGTRGAAVLLRRLASSRAERARAWAVFGLGLIGRASVQAAADDGLDGELLAQLDPLWVGLTENWLSGQQASQLEFVRRQTLSRSV